MASCYIAAQLEQLRRLDVAPVDLRRLEASMQAGITPEGAPFVLKGEEVEVYPRLAAQVAPIGRLDRKLAETLGYAHRTANAVVLTPAGKVLLQRRAPSPGHVYDLHLSLWGGHLAVDQSFTEAIESELCEELLLPALRGVPAVLGYDRYRESDDLNREMRALYLYVLSGGEYALVQRRANAFARRKRQGDRPSFHAWLKAQRRQPGRGEVWDFVELALDQLIAAPTAVNSEAPRRQGKGRRTRYLLLADSFRGEDGLPHSQTTRAFFTPDLLDRLLDNKALVARLQHWVDKTKAAPS